MANGGLGGNPRIMKRKIIICMVVSTLLALSLGSYHKSKTTSLERINAEAVRAAHAEEVDKNLLQGQVNEFEEKIKTLEQQGAEKDKAIQDLQKQLQSRRKKQAEDAQIAAARITAEPSAVYATGGTVAAAGTHALPGSPGISSGGGSGSCEAEIAKYDWPQATALSIMRGESSGDPGILNYNPLTFDHSVGCFQINLWGANAAVRPSEAALKNAAVNVAEAYKIFVGQGRQFCTRGGWINTCIKVGISI